MQKPFAGKLRLITFLFILLTTLLQRNSNAQFFSTGVEPSKTKWEQINTENFQVIFQQEFDIQAQKVANILEFYYQKEWKTLNHKPAKISVIIHNQTIMSNGYVGIAPNRIELYATPPQDNHTDLWLKHLCIHELRHVIQIDKLNQGITKILKILFGQQATGLVAGQLPMWFYEGDAVCIETAFGKSGRGRIPQFHRGIRTHILTNEKTYTFDKMLLGSFKDYVPNHYQLGYQLTAFARYKYGVEVWSNVQDYVARNSYTLIPTSFAFYRGVKKNTGLSQKELYHETFNYLDSLWKQEIKNKNIIQSKQFQKYSIKGYENYINPISIEKNQIIALKKGLSHIPQFVKINEFSEEILFEPGYLISEDFSYSKNTLVWAEYKADIRWENREFTSIILYNVNTGKKTKLVKKSRYFAPAINKSAKKLAVVEITTKNKNNLVILNAKNGDILKTISARSDRFIQRPEWSETEKDIYAIEITEKGKQIVKCNLNNQQWETVLPIKNADVQRIKPTQKGVYFHSTCNGIDNIYFYNSNTKQTYQISDSKFGISEFDLNENGGNLVVNEYSSHGFRIATIPLERASWKRFKDSTYTYKFAKELSKQEQYTKGIIPEKEYHKKPYRKAFNMFNFHSWVPAFIDFDNIDVSNILSDPLSISNNTYPGIMLLSQNKLSSIESVLGYGYKKGNHHITSSMTLKGQYPVIKFSAGYGSEQLVKTIQNATWLPETSTGYNYNIDISIPFIISTGKFTTVLKPVISLEYFDNWYYNYAENYYIKGLEYIESKLLFFSLKQKAKKDIIPKLGTTFRINLMTTPFDEELYGYLYSADATFYLPGGINKAFKINAGYQFQEPKLYLMNGYLDFPRGIQNRRSEKLFKIEGDYVFPIAYPDLNLGSFLYFKRLRGSLFLDYAYNSYRFNNNWINEDISSLGMEFSIDYHLFRTMFLLNSGLRFGYSPTEKNIILEVLFGIDLYNF